MAQSAKNVLMLEALPGLKLPENQFSPKLSQICGVADFPSFLIPRSYLEIYSPQLGVKICKLVIETETRILFIEHGVKRRSQSCP